jgi:hypothetical protein
MPRLPQGTITLGAQKWMDFQTGKVQKNPLKEQSITEQYYESLYGEYNDRQMSEMTHATITIPKGTRMMVWNDHRSFVGDILTYIDFWKNRGEHYFTIPKGKELSVEHYSTKDISIPMVVFSTLMSHIIADRTGTNYRILENQERYGMWVKMYENPTYIPQLEKKIVAYGVWEQDIPEHVNMDIVPTNQIYNPAHIHTTITGNPITGGTIVPGNTNIWKCQYCGKDTSTVDMDYLHGTDHLECTLRENNLGLNC